MFDFLNLRSFPSHLHIYWDIRIRDNSMYRTSGMVEAQHGQVTSFLCGKSYNGMLGEKDNSIVWRAVLC